MLYNGTYTVRNVESGEHRTFQIKTQKEDARFAPGERVVALLSGPDNESDYRGFGFVRSSPDKDKVLVWRKHRGEGKPSAFEYFALLLVKIGQALGEYAPDEEVSGEVSLGGRRYSVHLAKRCLICNRKLTTVESIQRGVGPECAARIGLAS